MTHLICDLRFALRALGKKPLFSVLTVLTLAVGTSGVSLMFSLTEGVLLRDLDYRDPERLVSVWKAYPSWQSGAIANPLWDRIQFTYRDALSLQEDARLLSDVAFFAGWGSASLTGLGSPMQLSVGLASSNLFDVVGRPPILGRSFLPTEGATEAQSAHQVVLLSHSLWRERFGQSAGVLEQSVLLDGVPFRVIGVLPPDFRLESMIVTSVTQGHLDQGRRDVWIPIGQPGGDLEAEGNAFEVLGRLAPGASVSQARQEVQSLLANYEGPVDQEARLLLRQDLVTQGVWAPLLLLTAGAALLWLVVCANVATLVAGNTLDRRPEIAIRVSLGATRWRLIRQLLTENLLLGVISSGFGLLLAVVGMSLVKNASLALPRLETVSLNLTVLFFGLGTGLLSGALFGLAPVISLFQRSAGQRLSGSARGMTESISIRAGLLVGQTALTVVLLITAGLLTRSLLRIQAVEPGFDPQNLATFQLQASDASYPDQPAASRFFEDLIRSLEAVPGVISASASYGLPFPGGAPSNSIQFQRDGEIDSLTARRRTVWHNYHQALGIPLLRGRLFSPSDTADSPGVMLLSRSLADRAGPEETLLARQVRFWNREWTVIGLVGDVRHSSLRWPGEPTFYVPFAQLPRRNSNIVVRTSSNAAAMLPGLQQAVWNVDPDVPIQHPTTLQALVLESSSDDRLRALVLSLFGSVALLLTGIGIFGNARRSVVLRDREMGIRLALGAPHRQLQRSIIGKTLGLALAGSVLGVLGAAGASTLLSAFLFDVVVWDGVTHGVSFLAISTMFILASWMATRRLTRLDPSRLLH